MVDFKKYKETRYALRNQHKIKAAYSQATLNRIIKSLDEYFIEGKKIEIKNIDGDPYPVIWINDIGHTCGLIIFYVTKKIWNVYNLAFKEFIN